MSYDCLYLVPQHTYDAWQTRGDPAAVRGASINIRQLNNISDTARATIQANDITKGQRATSGGGGGGEGGGGNFSLGPPPNFGQAPPSSVTGENFGQLREARGEDDLPPPSSESSSNAVGDEFYPPPPPEAAAPETTSFSTQTENDVPLPTETHDHGTQISPNTHDHATQISPPNTENAAAQTENVAPAVGVSVGMQTDQPHTHKFGLQPATEGGIWNFPSRKRFRDEWGSWTGNTVATGVQTDAIPPPPPPPPPPQMNNMGTQTLPIAAPTLSSFSPPDTHISIKPPPVGKLVKLVTAPKKASTSAITQTDAPPPPPPPPPPPQMSNMGTQTVPKKASTSAITQTDAAATTVDMNTQTVSPPNTHVMSDAQTSTVSAQMQDAETLTHTPHLTSVTLPSTSTVPTWVFNLPKNPFNKPKQQQQPKRKMLAIEYKPSPKKKVAAKKRAATETVPTLKRSVRMKKPTAKFSPEKIKKRAASKKKGRKTNVVAASAAKRRLNLDEQQGLRSDDEEMREEDEEPQEMREVSSPAKRGRAKRNAVMSQHEQPKPKWSSKANWRSLRVVPPPPDKKPKLDLR